MRKHIARKLPALKAQDPSAMSFDQLWHRRIDLNALANAMHARANGIKELADHLTDEINRREGNLFDITDHAVLQYLRRVRGLDVDAIRHEIRQAVGKAVKAGPLRSEAEAYVQGDLVFVVVRRRLVVTVYPKADTDAIEPMIVATAAEINGA